MNTNAIPAANREVDPKDNVKGAGDAEKINYAKIETERMESEYAGLVATHERLEGEAAAILELRPFPDDATALKAGGVIKTLGDLWNNFENARKVEVEPHLRRQNAINAFCKGHTEAIQPEDKSKRRTNPGTIDHLQTAINAYQADKEAKERARLAAEAAEAERVRLAAEKEAADKKAEADRLAAQAREELAAAERARNPEKIEEKTTKAIETAQQATKIASEAAGAVVNAAHAAERAQDARIATLAPTKDIVRTQGTTAEGGGVTLTTATEKYALVEDRTKFTDETKLALFDCFTEAEIAKAVRGYAVSVRYLKTLPGCAIGIRQAGVTR